MRTLAALVVGFGLALTATGCLAQARDYPDRPVRIIVPYPPGAASTVIARVIAQKLSESLSGQFYVENLAGAGGDIGTGKAAAAPADGYTLLVVSPDFVASPLIKAKSPYDPLTSFAPIVLLANSPGAISVHPSVPAHSMAELFALLKANPGQYTFATPGYGTLPHLEGERLFKLSRGLDIVHVPFQGNAPALNSTVAGHTSIMFGSIALVAPYVKAGTLRGLAVASSGRSQLLPGVPTKEEAGVPDYGGGFWGGALAPAGTPRAIIDLLHDRIAKVLLLPETKERLATLGFDPVGGGPEEFSAWIKSEHAKWAKVVREANLKVD